MKAIWNYLVRHKWTLASIGCTAVAAGALPVNPAVSALVGAVCTAVVAKHT